LIEVGGVKMKLADYLTRIDYQGPVTPDLDCLKAIHQQHLLNIPFENVDVQLRRPLDLDLERIFEKIVHRRRGGWCYEMNGLLDWALGQIGFDVMRLTGGVARKERGDEALGNHLVLNVNLDEPYIADVGLGNGLIEPIPLRHGHFRQGHREFRLELLDDEIWRFHNFSGAFPSDFDFIFAPADEALLESSCDSLQSDPESMFRQNLVCQRLRRDGVHLLLGRVLIFFSESGQTKTILNSAQELSDSLLNVFGLSDVDTQELWPDVVARHEVLFGESVPDEIFSSGD
jgi:N-hydroxyarylamine O-acetyltransferase